MFYFLVHHIHVRHYVSSPRVVRIMVMFLFLVHHIQLLESPIPAPAPAAAPSQKASSGDISGTKRGIIDPLVSKPPDFFTSCANFGLPTRKSA